MYRRNREGQASLEMVLVMPLLFTIILAVTQIGHMVYVQNTIEQASREAVRVAATQNNMDRARQTAAAICQSLGDGRLKVDITHSGNGMPGIGDMVTVTVIYSYGGIANIIRNLWQRSLNIEASSMMRIECERKEEIYH